MLTEIQGACLMLARQHRVTFALTVFALFFSVSALLWGIDNTVIDAWEFRQAQTGLSAYWLTQGGDWIAYETPVSGYPWTIPFEFPVYQWVVALAQEAGIPMNASGRLVSWVSFAVCLILIWDYCAQIGLNTWTRLAAIALIAAAPLYVFFSRSILIESTAVMLSLIYIRLILQLQKDNVGPWLIAFTLLVAALASMTKITTFFPFALLAGAQLLHAQGLNVMRGPSWPHRGAAALRYFLWPAVSIAIALGSLIIWLDFADALKSSTPYGSGLTSTSLISWNMGFRDNFMDGGVWRDVIIGRTIADLFGSPWIALALLGLSIIHRRYWQLQLLLLAAFILPFGTFWNLHIVHDYYQYANGFFLILAGVLAIDGLRQMTIASLPKWVPSAAALSLVVLLLGAQTVRFFDHFFWAVRSDQQRSHTAVISRLITERVDPDGVAFVFGYDWNSVIAYESRRRVITVPPFGIWYFEENRDLDRWTGGREIQVVVDCDRTGVALAREFITAAHGDLPGYTFLDCTVWDRVGTEPDVMNPPG